MDKVLNETKKAQISFNERYGVDFDIEDFHGVVNGISEIDSMVDANEMYRVEFSRLYKKAFCNYVDNKLANDLDFGVMIADFEKDLISPYSEAARSKQKNAPVYYGGWNVSTYLQSVKKYLDKIPKSKQEFAHSRYCKRELRMRDMRAFSNKVIKENDSSPEKLSTLYCYYSALSRANRERSGSFLSVLGNLSRHLAERRYMSVLKSYLEEKTGGPLSKDTNDNFKMVYDISCSDTIARASMAVDQALENNENRDLTSNNKEKVIVNSSVFNEGSSRKTDKVLDALSRPRSKTK